MSVTAAKGFVAAGGACGIKPAGAPDLALVATADGEAVPAAAVFTQNKAAAAPVRVSRDHLTATRGRAAAVVLNSGNANAATGADGQATAERMCALVADGLGCHPHEVLVCSTGLIGIPLPGEPLERGIPPLVDRRAADASLDAAQAIMTTDTHPKQAVVTAEGFTVGGMAKGAAMLAPNMATMLAVVTTDAALDAGELQTALDAAVRSSFNAISVDGCTSTNDTVIVLASGAAGPVDRSAFADALRTVCEDLAAQMVGDAEGATKIVRITVRGAVSDEQAERGARQVAESVLVKCSFYGQDPYWGRIASELGTAGIDFDLDRLTVSYGGVVVCRGGVAAPHDEAAVATVMAERAIEVDCDLGLGDGVGTILTNDLTHAYIDENMGTS